MWMLGILISGDGRTDLITDEFDSLSRVPMRIAGTREGKGVVFHALDDILRQDDRVTRLFVEVGTRPLPAALYNGHGGVKPDTVTHAILSDLLLAHAGQPRRVL